MKKFFRFVLKAFLAFIVLILVALGTLWVYYHTSLKPKPSISTLKVENEKYCLGVPCRTQPKTLDEYVELTAHMLFRFYNFRLQVWPVDVYRDQMVYFVSGDKKYAWEVNMMENTWGAIKPQDVPGFNRVRGHPDQFFPVYPNREGNSKHCFVQVIRQDDLLNEDDFDGYIYLGTYDKILSYIHEGFHITGQKIKTEFWTSPNTVSNPSGSNLFEDIDHRIVRVQILENLVMAIQQTNDSSFHKYLGQAIAAAKYFNTTFPEAAKNVIYQDKVEGSAQYVEFAATFFAAHDNINTQDEMLEAAGLYYSYGDYKRGVGAVNEAYQIGGVAGLLLDKLYGENSAEWKIKLIKTPDATPLKLLVEYYSNNHVVPEYIQPTEKYKQEVTSMIEKKKDRNYDMFLRYIYHLIFE